MKWKIQVSLKKPYEDLYAFEPTKEQALESFLDSLRAGEDLLDVKIIKINPTSRRKTWPVFKREKRNTKRRCKWRSQGISWCRKLQKFCNSPYEYEKCPHYEPKK